MILLRLLSSIWKTLSAPPPARLPGPGVLPAYVRMERFASGAALEPRVDLLVRQLAAELAGCRWCIEHGVHRWRGSFLPVAELGALRRHAASPLFSPREPVGGTCGDWAAGAQPAAREASRPGDSGRTLAAPHPSAAAQARLFPREDLAPAAAHRRGGDQELRLCAAPHGAGNRRLSVGAARHRAGAGRGVGLPGRDRAPPRGRPKRGPGAASARPR